MQMHLLPLKNPPTEYTKISELLFLLKSVQCIHFSGSAIFIKMLKPNVFLVNFLMSSFSKLNMDSNDTQ